MENQSNDDKAKLAMQMYLWYKDPAIFFRDLYNQEPYPYQARFIRDLPKLNRMMLLSAAGIGKTKLLACAGLWLAIVYSHIKKKSYDVLILSGNVELILYNTDYDKRKQKKSQKKYLDTEDDPDTLQAMDESDKEYRKKWNKVRC